MSVHTSDQQPDGPPGPLPGEASPAGEPQRVGPLEVRRFWKPDGRALIIYRRVEEREPGA